MKLFLILVVLFITIPALATDYYVSTEGNDADTGAGRSPTGALVCGNGTPLVQGNGNALLHDGNGPWRHVTGSSATASDTIYVLTDLADTIDLTGEENFVVDGQGYTFTGAITVNGQTIQRMYIP